MCHQPERVVAPKRAESLGEWRVLSFQTYPLSLAVPYPRACPIFERAVICILGGAVSAIFPWSLAAPRISEPYFPGPWPCRFLGCVIRQYPRACRQPYPCSCRILGAVGVPYPFRCAVPWALACPGRPRVALYPLGLPCPGLWCLVSAAFLGCSVSACYLFGRALSWGVKATGCAGATTQVRTEQIALDCHAQLNDTPAVGMGTGGFYSSGLGMGGGMQMVPSTPATHPMPFPGPGYLQLEGGTSGGFVAAAPQGQFIPATPVFGPAPTFVGGGGGLAVGMGGQFIQAAPMGFSSGGFGEFIQAAPMGFSSGGFSAAGPGLHL